MKNVSPLKDGPVHEMMAEADRYATENKDELLGIVDRYWQVAQKARGTPLGMEAQRKTDNAMLTHELKSHELIEKLHGEMDVLLKQGKVQDAFEVWLAFPGGWRTREIDEQILAILRRAMPPNFQPKR